MAKPTETRRDYWSRRDENTAKPLLHRFVLFMTCILRVIAFPIFFKHVNVLYQIPCYIILEIYFQTIRIDGYIPFTLNIWHKDHVARFIQVSALALGIVVAHVRFELVLGIVILHAYCAWFPEHKWIHVLTSLMLQVKA